MTTLKNAFAIALATLPAGHSLLKGLHTLDQITEPGPDPESAGRFLQEQLETAALPAEWCDE